MALITKCSKCGKIEAIDTHCGSYCYNCLDGRHPELQHKPDCRIAIATAKTKAQYIIECHEMIEEEEKKRRRSVKRILTLMGILRQIDPCPQCGGRKHGCPDCDHTGYKLVTDELNRIAEAPDPPPTY